MLGLKICDKCGGIHLKKKMMHVYINVNLELNSVLSVCRHCWEFYFKEDMFMEKKVDTKNTKTSDVWINDSSRSLEQLNRSRKRLTKNKKKEIIRLKKLGYNNKEIAKQLNRSRSCINQNVKKLFNQGRISKKNLTGRFNKRDKYSYFSNREMALVKDWFNAGFTIKEMSKALGRSIGSVSGKISRLKNNNEL